MNFSKKISKIGRKLAVMEMELDLLIEMDCPTSERIDEIKKEHTQLGNELIDLERLMKNRIWQKYGLDKYRELILSDNLGFEEEIV